MLQNETREDYRRKTSPQDRLELQRRAAEWPKAGGVGRAALLVQAALVYQLYLDWLAHDLGADDFPRWLSRHCTVTYSTCRRRFLAGRALALGIKSNRNQSGLLAELRERETTPASDTLDWG